MRPHFIEEPALNLEQLEQLESSRYRGMQPADLEADIALFDEWLEPTPSRRSDNAHRELLKQPHFQDA
ncbi:hypothetical protein GC163_06245 [bacterium]|nr:hypothetical protein [bacterium]